MLFIFPQLFNFIFSSSSQNIKLDVELEPIDLLGKVRVVRSLIDMKKGPMFSIHASRNPLVAKVRSFILFPLVFLSVSI